MKGRREGEEYEKEKGRWKRWKEGIRMKGKNRARESGEKKFVERSFVREAWRELWGGMK